MHKPNMEHVELLGAMEQAQGTLDRHRAHLERLVRYHDECPDGDPRKLRTDADIRRVLKLKNAAEEAAGRAADALIAWEDSHPVPPDDSVMGYTMGEDAR